MEIANALQLEAVRRCTSHHPLQLRRHAKSEVAQPIQFSSVQFSSVIFRVA